MNALAQRTTLPATSAANLAKVFAFESAMQTAEQQEVLTQHVIHGGMYARTVLLPADMVLTGALIKLATIVIVKGDCSVWSDGVVTHLKGYNILPASAGRKQIFVSNEDTHITMIFPTQAQSVEEAELEFTDQADDLASRKHPETNTVIITGE
jgi:hypothetical protein